ncbi:MAG TPA: 4Fe-4S dicluster domain-containing protein [bacterium]
MKYWRRPLDADKIKVPHGQVHIINDRCKGCGFCVEFCPRHGLEMSVEFNVKGYHPPRIKTDDMCLECHLCEMLCPEFAIYITLEKNNDQAADINNEKKEPEPKF